MLISSFIDFFEINVDEEIVEEVKALNQISVISLNKTGLKKVNNRKWVCKADEDIAFQEEERAGKSVVNA